MNIAQILTLDIGQTGVACEGTITYTQPPKNIVSPPDYAGEPYDFWSQFIVMQDNSGKIAANVNVDAGAVLAKGQHIRIEKARLKEYGGKLSLERAKLAKPTTPAPAAPKPTQQAARPTQQYADPKDAYWKEKAEFDKICLLHKDRGIALSYAKDLFVAGKLKEFANADFQNAADLCLSYIQDGVMHKPKSGKAQWSQELADTFERDHGIPTGEDELPQTLDD